MSTAYDAVASDAQILSLDTATNPSSGSVHGASVAVPRECLCEQPQSPAPETRRASAGSRTPTASGPSAVGFRARQMPPPNTFVLDAHEHGRGARSRARPGG
jgi:hypothetical protein